MNTLNFPHERGLSCAWRHAPGRQKNSSGKPPMIILHLTTELGRPVLFVA
jgi:hypothetical protein